MILSLERGVTHPKAPPLRPNVFLMGRAHAMRGRLATPSESILWARLRRHGLGVHFRRQHPIAGYVVDFAALSHRLIVEIDGAHHDRARDDLRDAHLMKLGYRVLRVKAWMVERHISVVLDVIRAAL